MKKLNTKSNADDVGVAANSDLQTNKTIKFDCRGRRLCPPENKQNGITLIALIITIIVMLILVGVTINVALNGNLFGKAETATRQTEEQAILEEMLSMMEITDDGKFNPEAIISKMEKKYTVEYNKPNAIITGKLGTYNYIVSETEIKIGNSGGETAEIPEELKRYILGADLTGRSIMEICDFSSFIDDELTEEDETETVPIKFLNFGMKGDYTEGYVYGKYNNVAYKIAFNFSSDGEEPGPTTPEGIEVIYTPTGREGQDLGTVTGNTKYSGWTIIYDNGETVEAVAPFTSDETLTLGSTTGNVDEAITSYNNAITLINDYVKAETTTYGGKKITEYTQDETTNGVRSVGAAVDPTGEDDTYSSTNLGTWNSVYNGVGKLGDMAYEQDIVRMSFHEKITTGTSYWVDSRCVYKNSSRVGFCVYCVYNGGAFDYGSLWNVSKSGGAGSYNPSYAVRPIISIKNP